MSVLPSPRSGDLVARAVCKAITPANLPVALGGYSVGQRGVRIDSPLEVNCLCLRDGETTIVIVTLDLLYVTQALREVVLAKVRSLGLTGEDIFMAASHTHYAPAIDSTKPLLGEPDSEYLHRTAATVVDAIRDAVLGRKENVAVEVRRGEAPIGINRRKRRAVRILRTGVEFHRVGMCPNPTGPTDPLTTVVSFKADGRTVAQLWSAACHPTGYPDASCVSAHWPGVVREHLRDLEGVAAAERTPVLFLQGFSGDVRPPSGSGAPKPAPMKTALNRLRLGRTFENPDAQEYASWANGAARQVEQIARLAPDATAGSSLAVSRTELPATRFARGAEGLPPVSFHRVSIGPLTIVGASAELVSGYASKVRDLAPDQHVIPVGCIDHVIGYWPLRHMFQEGGYEVVHHCPSFGIEACDPDIEAIVMQEFERLLRPRTADARV